MSSYIDYTKNTKINFRSHKIDSMSSNINYTKIRKSILDDMKSILCHLISNLIRILFFMQQKRQSRIDFCVDGHAARLGTVVTVLVAWTEFRYEVGSPSLGTKLVATRGQTIK